MSRIKPFLFAALFASLSATAQPSANSNVPEGFKAGTVVTAEHNYLQGHIKDNIKKSSEVLLITPDGKMAKYKAAQLSEVTIDNTNFIVDAGSFFKLVSEGPKVKLFQKASAGGDRIEYNGTEPIAVSGGVGDYDDYFIQKSGDKKLEIVRKKDLKKLVESWGKDCPQIADKTKSEAIALSEIVQYVNLYNTCSN